MKLAALNMDFFSGWAAVGAVGFGAYSKTNVGAPHPLSAYDARLIILTSAFILFQY